MPKIQANGIQLHYEKHGQGDPLVLIQGLGHPLEMWFKQVPALAEEFQAIIFDNRGTGQSDKPPGPYTISLMAHDVLGLLDQLGVGAAHLLGVSMGGFIAQELAIRSPTRVRKLVLLSTCYGGPEYWAALKQSWPLAGYLGHRPWRLWLSPLKLMKTISPGALYRQSLRSLVTPEFYRENPEVIDELVRRSLAHPPSLDTLRWQLQAVGAFNAENRVRQIQAPTLAIGAREDRIVPLMLTQRLAERIPKAQFMVIEGAAHLAFIEKAEELNQRVLEFLKEGGDQ